MIEQRCLKLWFEIENSLDDDGGRGNKRKFYIKFVPDFIHKL
jgi:hypothetical protein